MRYVTLGRPDVDAANEIRLPARMRVNARLASADVVHSFWIPSIAGKLDMIPGRVNLIALEPTRTGRFRGACAEFCGASHALMRLSVIVMEPEAFERWLQSQREPAVAPGDPLAQRGASAFVERGCGTCHTIRGITAAVGAMGPDLTHVASREHITAGAGGLSPSAADIERWITRTELIKPGVHMPAFTTLPRDDLAAISAYLARLE